MGIDTAADGMVIQLDRRNFKMRVWNRDLPVLTGNLMAIDTETHLIQEYEFPEMVVMSVCNGVDVDIVYYTDASYYIQQLTATNGEDTRYGFFNIGFDLGVIGEDCLYAKGDRRQLVDLVCRYKLYRLADFGWIPGLVSLKTVAKEMLGVDLEKGEERTNFRREKEVNPAMARYACLDAVATWLCLNKIPVMPTEDIQTLGEVVLDDIHRRGIAIDIAEFNKLRERIIGELATLREDLEMLGYNPLTEYGAKEIIRDILTDYGVSTKALDSGNFRQGIGYQLLLSNILTNMLFQSKKPKDFLEEVLKQVLKEQNDPDAKERAEACMQTVCKFFTISGVPEIEASYAFWSKPAKERKALLDTDDFQAPPRISSWTCSMLIREVFRRDKVGAVRWREEIPRRAALYGAWLAIDHPKPTQFMKDHLHDIELKHNVKFGRTGCQCKNPDRDDLDDIEVENEYISHGQIPQISSRSKPKCLRCGKVLEGDIQVSGSDEWIFTMYDIKDELVKKFVEYKHQEKMLSTYLNPEFIGKDGRIHARYNGIVRTTRTSCSKPNMQNVPGKGGFRACFVAPYGYVLASIDYGQLELCALAEYCFVRFGKSRMQEIINADLDLHSWFAARRLKIIDDSNDYDGSEESRLRVKAICSMIKEEKKKARKGSKAANFGFPGGMSDTTFLGNQRKNGNIEMTQAEATELRAAWFEAFPEMEQHMKPTREGNTDRYIATNIFGMTRRNCSFNSACNLQFQSIAAIGAKYAGWKLYRAKMPMIAFIHDEYMFEFPVEEAPELGILAAKIQVNAMKEIFPHVLVKAEPALMYVWDKEAEAVWSPTGRLEVWTPERKEVQK